MVVPARAFQRRLVGLDQVRDHLAVGRLGDPQVAVQEEIAQAPLLELGIARLYVAEGGIGLRPGHIALSDAASQH